MSLVSFEIVDPTLQRLFFRLCKSSLRDEIGRETGWGEIRHEPCTSPSSLGMVRRRECAVRLTPPRGAVRVRRSRFAIPGRTSEGMRRRLHRSLYLNRWEWDAIRLLGRLGWAVGRVVLPALNVGWSLSEAAKFPSATALACTRTQNEIRRARASDRWR